MFRTIISGTHGIARNVRVMLMPWLLLLGRVWFGQVLFVHQIMTMATTHSSSLGTDLVQYVPSSLEAALHGIAPLLVTTGLLTRPVSLVLLISSQYQGFHANGLYPESAKLVLLAWLVIFGPGSLSLDALLRRGLSWIPVAAIRFGVKAYTWIENHLSSCFLLIVRGGVFFALVSTVHPLFQGTSGLSLMTLPRSANMVWLVTTIACFMAAGFMTRISAVVCAAMIPLAGITMSMDDRFAVLLIFLLLATAGPGAFSMEALLVSLVRRRKTQDTDDATGDVPHIVVVGGGFGGLTTVRGLRNERCRITLIDQHNHHLFQPLLYQVATAALSAGQIATPIRSLFRTQPNVQVRLGEVTGVDTSTREVRFGTSRVKFDYLVVATGARHGYFGKDDWAPFAPGLKNIGDATSIRSRLLRAFEEAENAEEDADRRACLTFIIVGGGPTGIELAGAIAELARHGMEQEYRSIDPSTARVILLQAGPRLLPAFPASLSDAAEQSLRALGVEVCLESKVTSVGPGGVDVGDRHIPARTTLWAAGVAASPAAQWLARPADGSGRLIVADDLSVPGLQRIYAIGDTALSHGWSGKPVPGLAPAAKQQGHYVARTIGRQIRRVPPLPPFRYHHFGNLATIGRQAAVADIGGIRLRGAAAWWFWGAAHIAFLVGGRNRIAVILEWFWAYLTYRHSARLITAASPARLVTLRQQADAGVQRTP